MGRTHQFLRPFGREARDIVRGPWYGWISTVNSPRDPKGYVPTPAPVVDLMVARLFDGKPPAKDQLILDPGCGSGPFIEGVVRWSERHAVALPQIIGIELDADRCVEATAKFKSYPSVAIKRADFLARKPPDADYVIGNPPYVSIYSFSAKQKATFRARFLTARGRFDLYLLFFEQSIRALKQGGRLTYITPEKFLYVKTADPLRRLLGTMNVREVLLADEETFGDLVTYPTITTVDRSTPTTTRIVSRDRSTVVVNWPVDGSSLLPVLHGRGGPHRHGPTLADICVRVSCGIATGADKVFVQPKADLPGELVPFARPTLSGRQLVPGQNRVVAKDVMLIPYDDQGRLLPLQESGGALHEYLTRHRGELSRRVCTRRKPWWAFHDSLPIGEVLRPKILCKDITESPAFWLDREGSILPRHTVYYLVPNEPNRLDELVAYLSSDEAVSWLRDHCQRASNGFLRLQSDVLKRLPVPEHLVRTAAGAKREFGRRAALRPAALVLAG